MPAERPAGPLHPAQRALSDAGRARISERLRRGGASAAAAFVEAVTVQAAFPLGLDAPPREWARRERAVADAVLSLLMDAGTGGAGPAPGAPAQLRHDPPLLAAFFQNVDLLYAHGYRDADAVSALVMRALEGLDEDGSGPAAPPSTPPG